MCSLEKTLSFLKRDSVLTGKKKKRCAPLKTPFCMKLSTHYCNCFLKHLTSNNILNYNNLKHDKSQQINLGQ